jgi:uncharacterized protein (DUF2237 family)
MNPWIAFIVILFVLFAKKKQENFFGTSLKNIYGEPLKSCRKYKGDQRGSWDRGGYCSEQGVDTGLHQICFKLNNRTKNFSGDTGQSNWSPSRIPKGKNNNNHCMCLGAYSLYKAKQKKGLLKKTMNELNCSAIPETAFNSEYVKKWNEWNGYELPEQVVEGISSLYSQCYRKGNRKQKKYLRAKFCNLADKKEGKSLRKTNIYKKC